MWTLKILGLIGVWTSFGQQIRNFYMVLSPYKNIAFNFARKIPLPAAMGGHKI